MELQIGLAKLKAIIDVAEQNIERDSSLSETVTIKVVEKIDTHLGDDKIVIHQKSGYAECVSKLIGH